MQGILTASQGGWELVIRGEIVASSYPEKHTPEVDAHSMAIAAANDLGWRVVCTSPLGYVVEQQEADG